MSLEFLVTGLISPPKSFTLRLFELTARSLTADSLMLCERTRNKFERKDEERFNEFQDLLMFI
jgi:hypothetical protein